jgi:hypothetical protein
MLCCSLIYLPRVDLLVASMQEERLARQKRVRTRLWQSAMQKRSPGLALASAGLRAGHLLGNHTKTAIMSSLLLFKVRPSKVPGIRSSCWGTVAALEPADCTHNRQDRKLVTPSRWT